MVQQELSITDKLIKCNGFEREEEVKIILEGIISKLPQKEVYVIVKKPFKLFGDDSHYEIQQAITKQSLVKCYTGDYYGTRDLVIIKDDSDLVTAVESVEKIIPRKLTIHYDFSAKIN